MNASSETCIREVAEIVRNAGVSGVVLELTTDDRVRLYGPKQKVAKLSEEIRPYRDDLIRYLKSRRAEVVEESAQADRQVEVEVEDAGGFTACPHCHQPLAAPNAEIQVENLKKWQLGYPAIFQWSTPALERLKTRLARNDLIVTRWMLSVEVRRPDGSIYVHERGE
jgi:hypothetical protein